MQWKVETVNNMVICMIFHGVLENSTTSNSADITIYIKEGSESLRWVKKMLEILIQIYTYS